MFVFFFTVSLLFFFRWLNNHQNKMLVLSGLALGFGFLANYQMLAAGAVMIVSLLFLGWGQLKRLFSRFTLLIITAAIVIIPWIKIVYNIYASQTLSQWLIRSANGQPCKVTVQRTFSSSNILFSRDDLAIQWRPPNFAPHSSRVFWV